MVLDSCNAAGKKAGFKGMEMLQAVVLTADEWTPENELVTAAQKIQRKKIAGKFGGEIKVGRFASRIMFMFIIFFSFLFDLCSTFIHFHSSFLRKH